MVILDHRGTEVQARRISAEEEWLLNGGRLVLRELGAKQDFFKKNAAMNFPNKVHIDSWHGLNAGGRTCLRPFPLSTRRWGCALMLTGTARTSKCVPG